MNPIEPVPADSRMAGDEIRVREISSGRVNTRHAYFKLWLKIVNVTPKYVTVETPLAGRWLRFHRATGLIAYPTSRTAGLAIAPEIQGPLR